PADPAERRRPCGHARRSRRGRVRARPHPARPALRARGQRRLLHRRPDDDAGGARRDCRRSHAGGRRGAGVRGRHAAGRRRRPPRQGNARAPGLRPRRPARARERRRAAPSERRAAAPARGLRRAGGRADVQARRGLLRQAQERLPLKRYVIVGGEPELLLLLHLFPEGVEELDGAFAVYADEPPIGFDLIEADEVREGWEDAWKDFHHGVSVGRLWVGPPWESPPADLVPVVLDPGRAFGTGAHATTRLCLDFLQDAEPTSLLDVGCGSGVLSIAAAKLGFEPVTAIDIDDVAIEVTRANADVNAVAFSIYQADAFADDLPAAEL